MKVNPRKSSLRLRSIEKLILFGQLIFTFLFPSLSLSLSLSLFLL